MSMQSDPCFGEKNDRILDSLSEPVLMFDENGELGYANRAGRQLAGPGVALPRHFCEIVDCGTATFAQIVNGIRSGMAPNRLRCRIGAESAGGQPLFKITPIDRGALCTLADSSACQAARGAAEAQLHVEDMMHIYELLRRITQSINLDDTLASIAECMPALLRLDHCIIFLLQGREITSIKATGYIEKKFGQLHYDIDRLVATPEAVDRKRTVVINDARDNPEVSQELVGKLNASAVIVLPLIARGRTLGVMWLTDSSPGRRFGKIDVLQADLVSGQAAIAIDNALLFRQLSRTNRQLEDSYERLKNLDSMKMEFFSLLSHELRTPLTTIKGYADLLEDGVLGTLNAEQSEKLTKISAGVDRMTKIVDSLSDLSGIASKKYAMDIIPVSLNDMIGEVTRGIGFMAERKGIALSVDVPADLPRVCVDRARIMQVILNIVNNAIKYTPAGGRITIRAKDEADYVLVSVHDTGIGIPHKDLENIFSGFYHAGYKLSYEYKGAGLGLALSKGIVESHGGRIWAESEEGKGSTFFFTLPRKVPKKR